MNKLTKMLLERSEFQAEDVIRLIEAMNEAHQHIAAEIVLEVHEAPDLSDRSLKFSGDKKHEAVEAEYVPFSQQIHYKYTAPKTVYVSHPFCSGSEEFKDLCTNIGTLEVDAAKEYVKAFTGTYSSWIDTAETELKNNSVSLSKWNESK